MSNHDSAFVEDAEIDASLNVARDGQSGGDGAVNGGPDMQSSLSTGRKSSGSSSLKASEQTPLLGREDELEENEQVGDGFDDQGQGQGGSWNDDFSSLPWWKRPSVFWILPVFQLATLAFGGVFVPQVTLILELVCRNYIADRSLSDPNFSVAPVIFGDQNPQCQTKEVQARVAQFNLAANAISGLLSAIVSPKLGALSDRYGRKKIIVLVSIGGLCKEIIMIGAARDPDTYPVSMILLGFAFDGLSGSFTTMMALVHSYATDTTTPANRNSAFGYFHSCLFIGIALGPLVAGKIIEKTGTVLTIFYIAFVFHLLFITIFLCLIPESVTKARQLAARDKYQRLRARLGPSTDWLNSWRSINIFEPLKILYPKGPGANAALRRNLVLLSAIDTIIFGVAMGSMTVVVIYVNYQFRWDTVQTSFFTSIVNSSRVFGLLCVLPLITWLFRRRRAAAASATSKEPHQGADNIDLNVIRVAVFFDMLGYLGYSLSRTGSLFILSGCVAAVGGIGSPTLQSTLTKHVPPDKTGQILGANGLLHALARVAGPAIFNGIYSLTVGRFTQTVFVCLTATFFIAFTCSLFVKPHVFLRDMGETPEDDSARQADDESSRGLLQAAQSSDRAINAP